MPAIRPRSRLGIVLAALSALALVLAGPADAHGGGKGANVYKKRNLVSDIDGVARITDANLVNPWGLAFGPATPAWVSDNGTDVSTLYSGGVRKSIPVTLPLVVSVPGAPTGTVFNPTGGFKLNGTPAKATRTVKRTARKATSAAPCLIGWRACLSCRLLRSFCSSLSLSLTK